LKKDKNILQLYELVTGGRKIHNYMIY